LSNIYLLNENERSFLKENIPIKTINKNQLLLSEGEISRAFYFIIDGSIRLYYNVGLEEKTAFFYFENMFVSSYESFTKQTPSKHNLQTIEKSTIAVIEIDTAYKLLELFPKFDFLARVMMEEELIVCQEIISSFITLNAEKRYVKLLETNNQILQRIPQYQLATFLGVTAETLSRIRKRIYK
jgi:CRP-like cAMP-binding protein